MKVRLSCRQLILLYSACKLAASNDDFTPSERKEFALLRMHFSESTQLVDDIECKGNCLDCHFTYDLCDGEGNLVPFDHFNGGCS